MRPSPKKKKKKNTNQAHISRIALALSFITNQDTFSNTSASKILPPKLCLHLSRPFSSGTLHHLSPRSHPAVPVFVSFTNLMWIPCDVKPKHVLRSYKSKRPTPLRVLYGTGFINYRQILTNVCVLLCGRPRFWSVTKKWYCSF